MVKDVFYTYSIDDLDGKQQRTAITLAHVIYKCLHYDCLHYLLCNDNRDLKMTNTLTTKRRF